MDANPVDTTDTNNSAEQPKGWRGVLPIHPAAELFPLMTREGLRELADDIEANDLVEPVVIYRDQGTDCLLDGRNRLDALELLGQEVCDEHGHLQADARRVGHDGPGGDPWPNFDPYTFVVSRNLHRRHLTLEQKRELAAKLLKLNPTQSNRQAAEAIGLDHKTIAAVRAEGEATGEIPQLEKTVGLDGRARPGRRATTTMRTHAPKAPEPAPKVAPPEAVTKAVEAMRTAWREVELQADANNTTMLKAATGNLITKASGLLKAMGGLQ